MKHIYFKKINIKNFYSIGEDPVEVTFKKGLNVITGDNEDKEDSNNGVGKSTILEAIFFALFGQTVKNVPVGALVNWHTNKPTEIDLTFQVRTGNDKKEYQIIRTLSPGHKVRLFEDGKCITQNVGPTTNKIKKITGATPDLFEQCVLMSVNQTEPYLAKTAKQKSDFLKSILNLDVFKKMKNNLRQERLENKNLYGIALERFNNTKNSLMTHRRSYTENEKQKKEFIERFDKEKNENKKKIEELEKEISSAGFEKEKQSIKKFLEETAPSVKEKHTKKLHTLISDRSEKKAKILSLKSNIKEIDELGDKICLSCKRPFSDQDKDQMSKNKQAFNDQISKIEKEVIDINEEITKSENKLRKIDEAIEEAQDKKTKIRIKENYQEECKRNIENLKNSNKTLDNTIDDLNKSSNILADTITKLEEQFIEAEEQEKKLNKEGTIIRDAAKIVGEEGVVSFIISKMLTLLNTRVNFYLRKLDSNCVCEFDSDMNEHIYNEKGKEVSYFSFSGGERKRLDLALLFTFLDIRRLQSNISVSLSMYDELLDSSLDSKGIELVLNILHERVNEYNEAVYLISHRPEAIKHASGDIVYLSKKDGITRKTEYESKF